MTLPRASRHPIMAITQDNLPWSHVEQAARLCAAGAKWIQLRMKHASPETWQATALAVTDLCHRQGAICIVNDSVEIARAAAADGVHLGRLDRDWRSARAELGPGAIIGGTVNNADDARRAVDGSGLDYVGVGPWRFTTTKQNLSPVLGPDGIAGLVRQLGELPAWAIGGIEAADLPAVRATGAVGAAVSGGLFRRGEIEANYRALLSAWDAPRPTPILTSQS